MDPTVAPTGNCVAWCWNAPDEWSANGLGDNGATLASPVVVATLLQTLYCYYTLDPTTERFYQCND